MSDFENDLKKRGDALQRLFKGFNKKDFEIYINSFEKYIYQQEGHPNLDASEEVARNVVFLIKNLHDTYPDFPFDKAFEIINDAKIWHVTKYKIIENIKKYYKTKETVKQETDEIRKSPMLPTKKLKLKEDVDVFYGMTAKKIYAAGKEQKDFDFEKGLDALIRKDRIGLHISLAGVDWKRFDFKKGLEALIKKDERGALTLYCGQYWKQFDFEKGLDALIEKDKFGRYIYLAGFDWSTLNQKKALSALRKINNSRYGYYREALRDWPKSKETIEKETSEIKNSPMLPTKKLSLKEWLKEVKIIKYV